jgi:hypothetical protein
MNLALHLFPVAQNSFGALLLQYPASPLTSLHRLCAFDQKRHPLFSITSTLFLIHNFRHPLFSITSALFFIHNFRYPYYFLSTAHSLPKTPGGSIGSSIQKFPNQSLSNHSLARFISRLFTPLTPMKSHSFPDVPSNPFRITLIHKTGRGRVSASSLLRHFAASFSCSDSASQLRWPTISPRPQSPLPARASPFTVEWKAAQQIWLSKAAQAARAYPGSSRRIF